MMMKTRDTESSTRLDHLLAGIAPAPPLLLSDLSLDSRTVSPGGLFIACPGERHDGRKFIAAAIAAGAGAVLQEAESDNDNDLPQQPYSVPVIPIPELRSHLPAIAARFFNYPARRQRIVGVTGTNGKTTVVWMLAHALGLCGKKTAIISTLGNGIPPQLRSTVNTTPDAIEIQRLLAAWQDMVGYTAMEVSSHALAQGRVKELPFFIGVFTNLGDDHLDYHPDKQHYAETKYRLFEQQVPQHAVINLDDAYGRALFARVGERIEVLGYTCDPVQKAAYHERCPLLLAESLPTSGKWHIESPWGQTDASFAVAGQFMLDNLLASLCCLLLCEVPFTDAIRIFSSAKISLPPGRLERFQGTDTPLLIVDYAHSPDALERVLSDVREHNGGVRLFCVFGCGGERDTNKRARMGDIASRLADYVIITSDNPRSEDPQEIIAQICTGIHADIPYECITDRREAILRAFTLAKSSDIVLIAGKGHESEQEIAGRKYPFSDREMAARLVARTVT